MPVKRASIATVLGLAGFALNLLPVEIFPGVHLIFGNILSILAAVKFGPVAGAGAGLITGLGVWRLSNEPFPLSAILFALEGVWVGYQTSKKERSPLNAVLSFWLLAGIWIVLIAQLIAGASFNPIIILLARSLINALLSGLLVEILILIYEVIRRLRAKTEDSPAHLKLRSIIAVHLMAMVSIPLLYISAHNVNDLRERILSETASASARYIMPLDGEIHSILQVCEQAVERAATLFYSVNLNTPDIGSLNGQLARSRQQRTDFQRICLGDAQGRTLACDPPLDESEMASGEIIQATRPFYNELLTAKSTVTSHILQQPGRVAQPAMVFAVPVIDERDEIKGFVVGWFDLSKFQEVVNRFKQKDETQVIADADGNLVTDSSLQSESYKGLVGLSGRWDYELIKDQNQSSFYYAKPDADKAGLALKHTHIISTGIIPETGWRVWSIRPLDSASRMIEEIYVSNLIVLLVALFSALALSLLLARWLTSPVGELQESAARIAAGNWSRPKQTRFLTADVDSLFQSFRAMAERLEESWNRQQHLLGEASAARGELEATFDAMTDAVAIVDIDDNLVRANNAFYEMHGLSAEEAVGHLYTELAHPEDNWQDCEACIARRAGRQSLVLIRKEAETGVKVFEVRVDPLCNPAGERIGSVQVIRDLTEIKAAEAEAEKAGSLLKNLVDSAFDVIYATDVEGRFLWANKRASELYGEDVAALEGQTFLRSIHQDDMETARKAFDMTVQGEAQMYECRFHPPDKGIRYALVTSSPIYSSNKVTAVLGIVRDITKERMSAEQSMLSDKLRALGQLASGIAHNFNNSLTAILGYTQMVMGKTFDTVLLQYLRTVEMAALDSAKMVQRIQNFARQRQGETLMTANLNQIIRDALDLTRSRWRDDARTAGISFDIIFRPEEGVAVRCDPSAIREVFVNIIINALDAMPEGGRLTVTTSVEGDKAVISFADTGCGIPEDMRQRVFDPFFTTKGPEGHGLGLAVAYGIVSRHNGEIEVESELGRGAIFTLKFPLAVIAETTDTRGRVGETARQSYVLVVDDEAPIRLLLSNLVRTLGHKVMMAENGLVALKTLEGASFDLVITDLSMPGLDGWSLAKEIRNRWPETKVMIVTGYGEMGDAIAPGSDRRMVDAFMSKPFDLSEIGRKINELLLDAERRR